MTLAANMFANGLARVWLAILHIVMTPFIAGVLGPDSYGIIAFSITVTLLLAFLDQALSPLLLRELSAHGADEGHAARVGDLLRAMEVLSWSLGLMIGVAIAFLAPVIADNLLARTSLGRDEVVTSIRLIGFAVAAQWPGLLYASGLMGLQRQDKLVLIRLTFVTAAYAGGLALISYVKPSAALYLAWSGAMALLSSLAMGLVLWRSLPSRTRPPVFDLATVRPLWRFGADNLMIGITAALLSQLPGLIVARFASVSDFAAYALAITLAMQVSTLLTQPVTATLLPHFSRLAAQGRDEVIAQEHHRWSQIITVLALPAIATLALYAEPLMRLWLGAASPLAQPVAALLPFAAIGALFNIIATPLYVLPVALNRPRLVLGMNAIAVMAMLPLNIWLTGMLGAKGAVIGWLVVNLGYYLLGAPALHAKLLPGHIRRWWLNDTLAPIAAVAVIYGTAWFVWPASTDQMSWLAHALLLCMATLALLMVMQTHARQAALDGVLRITAFLRASRQ